MREAKPFRVIVRGPVFWAAILLLLMLPCLFSLLTISRPNPSTVAASDLAEEFQSALDAFQKQYGFPGATAAYLLQDGTASVAATGVADEEAGTPMTVQSRMLSASIRKTFVDPVHASVTKPAASWSRSNFCSATSQCKRQKSTLGASSAFAELSTIESELSHEIVRCKGMRHPTRTTCRLYGHVREFSPAREE